MTRAQERNQHRFRLRQGIQSHQFDRFYAHIVGRLAIAGETCGIGLKQRDQIGAARIAGRSR